ncbi:Thermophilic serine proteinase precursor [Chlamydia abortus]|nr:Thermophilic serine proteinase precursor [Chlamydia abortus]
MRLTKALLSFGLVCILLLSFPLFAAEEPTPLLPSNTTDSELSWIIQWKNDVDPVVYENSSIISQYPDMNVMVVRPKTTENEAAWLDYWRASGQVEYIQPNHQYRIAEMPNDSMLSNQQYLKLIHAEEAWDQAVGSEDLVVAVVDTGIDMNHPDLKDHLIDGVNLIQPGTPPYDDNGHGTSVAGVLAAVSDNEIGVSGLLWRAQIMPIKALEADGSGDEDKLGEGIRYAVDNGARIVVLSLGLNKPSPFMKSIVQYAEDHGVLLVAAAGNEGNAVKYPAAYPTVIAVGGVTHDLQPHRRSNYGPELDIVAPWNVFTTLPGGNYGYKEGTSLAAPQVAAVAGLIWSKYPDLKPYQVRNLIRQSAQEITQTGWDPKSGYGLLRADRALTIPYKEDMYEGNQSPDGAYPISISQQINAALSGASDQDWFYIDAPYDGTLSFSAEADQAGAGMTLTYYTDPGESGVPYENILSSGADIQVNKGRSYIKLQADQPVTYRLTTDFLIYKGPFEDNDRQYKAYVLPDRSQTIVGTFHQENDHDWFAMHVRSEGTLQLTVSVDTARIDPVLLVQKQGEKELLIDKNGDGETETSGPMNVTPGTYYFRVSNIPGYSAPVVGEYTLSIEYSPKLEDPNEPNNRPNQASSLNLGKEVKGHIQTKDDSDWFQFRLNERSLVDVGLRDIPQGVRMEMELYDHSIQLISQEQGSADALTLSQELEAGTYYVRLRADQAFDNQFYRLKAESIPLTAGFRDVEGHWAEEDIIRLTNLKIVEGIEPFRFAPDQPMTRAQAAAVISRAFGLTSKSGAAAFPDVTPSHWAYDAISAVSQQGWIDGYPDASFQPERTISRMEMVALLAKVQNLMNGLPAVTEAPYADVDPSYWGAPILVKLMNEGWVSGYPDNTFRPDHKATRAEFVSVLAKLLK